MYILGANVYISGANSLCTFLGAYMYILGACTF